MVINRINNWFNLSKQYFFTYSEGFFNLSYLSNSPDVIVKSASKMPFMKHDTEKQMLHADTPFVKGAFYYVELEEGLWIMLSDMYYKNNLAYKPIYDKFLPANYYSISANTIENKRSNHSYEFNNFIVQNNSISFSKPAKDFLNCHFKSSKETMTILYFNENWATKNIINSPTTPLVLKKLFGDPTKEFLNYYYNDRSFKNLIDNISDSFVNSAKPNVFELKRMAYEYISLFFDSLEQKENLNSFSLSQKNKLKIQKVECYLTNDLYSKFPGIEVLAKKYKISPTKLKKDFKTLYGESLFEYFQKNKMRLALEHVENTSLKIKDIAIKFGYENDSKFSKAFFKHNHKTPSELRK